MSVLNNSLLLGAPAGAGGYSISRSLRFNSADSAYLSRTPASAGNRKTWTWAGWVKRSSLNSSGGTYQQLFTAGSSASVRDVFFFDQDVADTLAFYSVGSGFGGGVLLFRTNAVFRDPSAWYHIVLAFDTTQATAANRIKLYVNGVQQTFSTANYPSQNSDGLINSTTGHAIGRDQGQVTQYLNGYLADIHFIDGQALDPTSFGEFSATTGVWMPKQYTGTYGTNGFKLSFSDNSTTAALGTDSSGAGNTWTVNNLSVTAGAGNDSLVDVPVNGSEVDSGLGGQVRGNYATWNPLSAGNITLSNGNLSAATANQAGACGTVEFPSSGKWYYELTFAYAAGQFNHIGIIQGSPTVSMLATTASADGVLYRGDGNIFRNTGGSWSIAQGSLASYTANDVIGAAINCDSGTLQFYKNGASVGTAVSLTSGRTYTPFIHCGGATTSGGDANFGQRPFAYTAPSGFKALCTANLPAPVVTKPSQFFDVSLWTGDNSNSRTISGLGFSPDLVWKKRRTTNGDSHYLVDSVRGDNSGVMRTLFSNQTVAEQDTNSAQELQYGYISGLTSSGFTVAAGSSGSIPLAAVNDSSYAYVAWAWDAGSSTVTNTQGSITSQVRANASAGFSIVSFSGTVNTNQTVGHGLGVAPSMIIFKNRTDGTQYWTVYHASLGNTKGLVLNGTDAAVTYSGYFNNTTPTSTVFSVGSPSGITNGSSMIAYCFAPVAGYSSFGSYTGNGSTDGPFVYTGFRPRWILIKRTDASGDSWFLFDTAREPENVLDQWLAPNLSNAETATSFGDSLSNGFKLRSSISAFNGSGSTYIYAAFAESPFQYARAR